MFIGRGAVAPSQTLPNGTLTGSGFKAAPATREKASKDGRQGSGDRMGRCHGKRGLEKRSA